MDSTGHADSYRWRFTICGAGHQAQLDYHLGDPLSPASFSGLWWDLDWPEPALFYRASCAIPLPTLLSWARRVQLQRE